MSGGGVYLKIPPFLVTGVELSGPENRRRPVTCELHLAIFSIFQPNLRVLVSGGGVYLKIPPFLVTGVALSGPLKPAAACNL